MFDKYRPISPSIEMIIPPMTKLTRIKEVKPGRVSWIKCEMRYVKDSIRETKAVNTPKYSMKFKGLAEVLIIKSTIKSIRLKKV